MSTGSISSSSPSALLPMTSRRSSEDVLDDSLSPSPEAEELVVYGPKLPPLEAKYQPLESSVGHICKMAALVTTFKEEPLRISTIALKVLEVALCAGAVYPYTNVARKVGGVVFAVGEEICWTTVYTRSAWTVTDAIKEAINKRKIGKFGLRTSPWYWTVIILGGIGSMVPDVLVLSDNNDGNLFFSIGSPSVIATFAMHSMDSFTKRILTTNNVISRFARRIREYRGKKVASYPLFAAKHEFARLMEGTTKTVFEKGTSSTKEALFSLLNQE